MDLRDLQLKVESEYSVEHTRQVLNEMVEWFSTREDNQEVVDTVFNDFRAGFKRGQLEDKGIFLFNPATTTDVDVPDEYKKYSLGLYTTPHSSPHYGRLVYPVRDPKGNVMGLCGWVPDDEVKYLDSHTYGYKAKSNVMYGMEKLYDYYTSNEPVFIVEGIPCCNYLRSKGLQALALLGSSMSKYVMVILKRFGNRCCLLPDNDEAGLNVLRQAKYSLPQARCYVSIIAKDPDDTRRKDNGAHEEDFLNDLRSLSNPFVNLKTMRPIK